MIEVLGHFILQNKTPFDSSNDTFNFWKYPVQLGFSVNSLYTIERVIHYVLLY